MMTVRQALSWAEQTLKKAKIPSAALDGEVLLALVLEKPKEFIYLQPNQKLTAAQEKKFKKLIARRQRYEPVAYLTGEKWFYGLPFRVDRRVLIPRPATEILVEEILKSAQGKKIAMADVGTGSGCIAIALKKNLPAAKIYGLDQSKPALSVARRNAKLNQVKIQWRQGDLLQPLKKPVDIILANLPYLQAKQIKPELRFEPRRALVAGSDGLAVYKKLFVRLAKVAWRPKVMYLECEPRQCQQLIKLGKKYWPDTTAEIKKDLAGHNRLLIIRDFS